MTHYSSATHRLSDSDSDLDLPSIQFNKQAEGRLVGIFFQDGVGPPNVWLPSPHRGSAPIALNRGTAEARPVALQHPTRQVPGPNPTGIRDQGGCRFVSLSDLALHLLLRLIELLHQSRDNRSSDTETSTRRMIQLFGTDLTCG